MFAKYGKYDRLEGVFDTLAEAVKEYYGVDPNQYKNHKYRKRISSSIINTQKRKKCGAGWYKIED